MRKIRSCLGLVSVVALSACVATVWDRPGTTQAVLNMDNAQCQLYAEGAVPDFDPGTVSTGQIERDLAVNAAAGIIGGIAHGVAISQRHDLCMGPQGYVAHAIGAPPALPLVQPAYAGVQAAPVGAAPLPQVPYAPVALAVFGPAPTAVCPPGLNPRWSNPDIGETPMLICIRGNKYPAFLWRNNSITYSF